MPRTVVPQPAADAVKAGSRLRPIQRQSTAAVIADQLRNAIASGRFAPGEAVTEQGLAEELQVSRGPVREALQRLLQEGLLVGERNRGVVVMSLTDEDIADLYVARLALEREAALLLAARQDPAALAPLDAIVDQLLTACKKKRWAEAAELDREFHAALIEATGSPRLMRMYATLMVETSLCLKVLRSARAQPSNLAEEHQAVLRAIRAGDVSQIGAVLEEHMHTAEASLVGSTEASLVGNTEA